MGRAEFDTWQRALWGSKKIDAFDKAAQKSKELRDRLADDTVRMLFGWPVYASPHLKDDEVVVIRTGGHGEHAHVGAHCSCLGGPPPVVKVDRERFSSIGSDRPEFKHLDPSRMGRPYSVEARK